jgi:hypothetical protein
MPFILGSGWNLNSSIIEGSDLFIGHYSPCADLEQYSIKHHLSTPVDTLVLHFFYIMFNTIFREIIYKEHWKLLLV